MSRHWTTTALLVLAGAYVVAEIIANASLLSVVGAHSVDHQAVEDMERIMRILSGFGAVILISNLTLPLFKRTRHRIKVFVLIASFIGPFTYLGVQLMVEGIVGKSTKEARDAGVMAYIYRMGMTNGAIGHSASLVADKHDAQGKALLGSLALYVFPGSVLGEAVSTKKDQYAKAIFTAEMNRPDLKANMSAVLWKPFNQRYGEYLAQYESQTQTPNYDAIMAHVRSQEAKCVRYRARKDCGTPDFVLSDYVKREVNQKIRKEAGFAVVEDYWLTDRDSFRRAMIFSALKAAKAKGKAKDVSFPMGRQEFAASPDVDRWLNVAGFPYYFRGMGLSEGFWGWYEDKPRAIAALTHNLTAIDVDGYQAEQIYRSMIIPPIALFLSLFFATMNLISLLAAWISVRINNRWSKAGVRIALTLVVAVTPLLMSNTISRSEWYETITVGMSDASPLRYYVATWILQVEPLIGFLGH